MDSPRQVEVPGKGDQGPITRVRGGGLGRRMLIVAVGRAHVEQAHAVPGELVNQLQRLFKIYLPGVRTILAKTTSG